MAIPTGAAFRLWAPGARQVALVLDPAAPGERRLPMHPAAGGFFELTVEGAGAGTRYLYGRDDGLPLPDPASRFQPEGVHGPSEVVDLPFPWTDAAWRGLPPEELVVYELHVGTFTGEGTFSGVAARLDHLAALGVTAVEIMPVAAFPGRRGWGYDGVFHFAPHAGYGRPPELQALVNACHARGIAVILDLVTNHFGPEGNAMWTLAPAFFRADRPTSWAAGHAWEAEAVLAYFDELALFWATAYHVDGLRLDAFHAIPRAARRTHLARMARALDQALPPELRFTLLLESVDNETSLLTRGEAGLGELSPRLHLCQLNFDFQRAAHAMVTGERHGEYGDFAAPADELGRCLRSGFAFRQRHSAFHGRARGEETGPDRWDQLVNFLQNHDSVGNRYLGERLDRLVDADSLRAVTALLLLHPALPFLFMGQEWGATTPYHFFVDLPERLAASVSAGRRRGFREVDVERCTTRAPDCTDEAAFASCVLRWSELEAPRHGETLRFTRDLLALRRQLIPGLSRETGDARLVRQGDALALHLAGAAPVVLACNLEDAPVPRASLEIPAGAGLLYATRRPVADEVPARTTLLFRPSCS
jgi:malto-oligosyltrehalose trehalohydrolase